MRSKPTWPASDVRRPRSAPASCAPRRNSPTPASSRSIGIMLSGWPPGGSSANEVNPVARSNVCLEIDPPATPSFYAFSYTVPGDGGGPNGGFVAAGSGEAREGAGSYAERIVRFGDQSPAAMREKTRYVLDVME